MLVEELLREAVREVVNYRSGTGLDDPVQAYGRLTENTSPPGDLYGMRITSPREVLRDALARLETGQEDSE